MIRREGMRPYEYLEQMGVLSDRFLGAHSLLLSDREKELVRDRGVILCHCPFSNCGKGVPRTPELLEMGVVPGFGYRRGRPRGPKPVERDEDLPIRHEPDLGSARRNPLSCRPGPYSPWPPGAVRPAWEETRTETEGSCRSQGRYHRN